jgi:hypothetical protein
MDIYIERCIWCCLECMRIKHLQYDLDYEDYNDDRNYYNDNLDYNNDLDYNNGLYYNNGLDYNNGPDIKQHCTSTKNFSPSKPTYQKPKINQSLVSTQHSYDNVSNMISDYTLQPPSSTTNDFAIDLPILKIEEDDEFELLEKNE